MAETVDLTSCAPVYEDETPKPRVAIFGLASDYGCQLQITNVEEHLLDILSNFELVYWQLVSSGEVPEDYDIAIIEGTVTTDEHIAQLESIRGIAGTVIAIGSCACTAGIPGLAASGYEGRAHEVYGDIMPKPEGEPISPRPVSDVIAVDYEVPACPIDPMEFIKVLHQALRSYHYYENTEMLCAVCRENEYPCLYERGEICLGLVTRTGCGARCVALGRSCKGCRGISPNANMEAARDAVKRYGGDLERFERALQLFSTVPLAKESHE